MGQPPLRPAGVVPPERDVGLLNHPMPCEQGQGVRLPYPLPLLPCRPMVRTPI